VIIVNTSHIGDEGLSITGEEDSSLLELDDPRTGVPTGPIKYSLHASMAGKDLVVMGTASVPVKGECGRCLEEAAAVIKASGICHHFEKVPDQEIDITNDIREDILMAMPVSLLCAPSCKGLCSQCGADLNKAKCRCKPPKDGPSAWDALDKLEI